MDSRAHVLNGPAGGMRSRHRTHRLGRCFSFVEVMVAILVLMIVLAGAYGIIHQSFVMLRVAMDHYTAATLAHNRIETMKGVDMDHLADFVEAETLIDARGLPDEEGPYRRTVTVDEDYAPGVAEVVVTVEVRDAESNLFQGRNQRVSILMNDLQPEESP